ncbi:RNA-directed DNA polymerase, eukaryota, reverse transcriptase zinc-binding domain protein [Tanacetum coccineum]
MVQCVMCPEGKCSEDCPTLDVLSYDGPSREESFRKGQKLQALGMEVQDIKEKFKEAGDVDAKNKLINKWIEDYESSENDELFHFIRNRTFILKQQRLLDEQTEIIAERQNVLKTVRDVMKKAKAFIEKATSNSVVDDETAPTAAPAEGLPGSKKRSTLLDGPSLKD